MADLTKDVSTPEVNLHEAWQNHAQSLVREQSAFAEAETRLGEVTIDLPDDIRNLLVIKDTPEEHEDRTGDLQIVRNQRGCGKHRMIVELAFPAVKLDDGSGEYEILQIGADYLHPSSSRTQTSFNGLYFRVARITAGGKVTQSRTCKTAKVTGAEKIPDGPVNMARSNYLPEGLSTAVRRPSEHALFTKGRQEELIDLLVEHTEFVDYVSNVACPRALKLAQTESSKRNVRLLAYDSWVIQAVDMGIPEEHDRFGIHEAERGILDAIQAAYSRIKHRVVTEAGHGFEYRITIPDTSPELVIAGSVTTEIVKPELVEPVVEKRRFGRDLASTRVVRAAEVIRTLVFESRVFYADRSTDKAHFSSEEVSRIIGDDAVLGQFFRNIPLSQFRKDVLMHGPDVETVLETAVDLMLQNAVPKSETE